MSSGHNKNIEICGESREPCSGFLNVTILQVFFMMRAHREADLAGSPGVKRPAQPEVVKWKWQLSPKKLSKQERDVTVNHKGPCHPGV